MLSRLDRLKLRLKSIGRGIGFQNHLLARIVEDQFVAPEHAQADVACLAVPCGRAFEEKICSWLLHHKLSHPNFG